MNTSAPQTYERLITAITDCYDELSNSFQRVAGFIVQNPNAVAMQSARAVAEAAGVQPSTLVRFSQGLGFSGYKDMQRLFQSRLIGAAPDRAERLSSLEKELGAEEEASGSVLRHIAISDVAGLRHLMDGADEQCLDDAADLLAGAKTVYVLGQFRAYPIASYLYYALTYLRRDARLLDGVGGMTAEQSQIIGADGVLIAVSFRYYAREVVDIVEAVSRRGISIIVITDSTLSPLVKHSRILFEVPEGRYNFSCSLAAPMCLAQTLVVTMARKVDPDWQRKWQEERNLRHPD